MDLASVTGGELANHSLTILAETSLTSEQATMFSSYVAGGGKLLAMKPDSQITSLFGLGAAAGFGDDHFLMMHNSALWSGGRPGSGLSNSALQIHGRADLYSLQAGAVMLAELYSDISTATGYPAVVGSSSGSTAAFTYDLAKNVVYTRQGNPANANVDVDGDTFLRTIDLFQTIGGGSPWVNLNLVPVPQADEQQRLFARLVKQMIAVDKPMPQAWYFPGTNKTMLILTADSHANLAEQFQYEISSVNSRYGKLTFYLAIAGQPSDANVQIWRSEGNEFGIHPYSFSEDPYYPITNLTQGYEAYDMWYSGYFSSPKSHTVRNHRIAWEGWTTAAEIARAKGIELDTNFYHWGQWLKKSDDTWAHGYVNGSGQPMKFIRSDGTILDIYQQLTQLVDEQLVSGAGVGYEGLNGTGAFNVSKQLVDASQAGYYSALMTQFHVDYYSGNAQTWAEDLLTYAHSLNIPAWNADSWLNFTSARHDANYTDIAWNSSGHTLTFNLEANGAAGVDMTSMLPAAYGGLDLDTVSVDGTPTPFTVVVVNGVSMAFIDTSAQNHIFSATYALNTNTPTPTSTVTLTPTPTASLTPTITPTPTPTTQASQIPNGVLHTTYNDFNVPCAVLSDTHVSDRNDGSVELAAVLNDDFMGTTLDTTKWESGSWIGGDYTPVIGGSVLTLPPHGWVRSITTFTHGAMEVTAQFGVGSYQNIGFGSIDFVSNRYLLFSTYQGTGDLYVRANNNGSEQRINLGPLPAGMNRYRIEWVAVDATTDRALYYLNGTLAGQFDFDNTGGSGFLLYLSNDSDVNLLVDYAQAVPPYQPSGSYTSCVLDAGVGNVWLTAAWDAVATGSEFTLQTRTSLDNSSWTNWTTVGTNGGNIADPYRFAQYHLLLTTADVTVSPVVNSVTLLYGQASADLSLTKTVNFANPYDGDSVVFTLVLSNAGPNAATGVTVKDILPSDAYTYTNAIPSAGNYDPVTGIWNVGSVSTGINPNLQLLAIVKAVGVHSNIAEVWTSDALDVDSTPGNGVVTEDDYSTATTNAQPSADLSIVKSGGATAVAGEQVTYNLAITNLGASTAATILVTDTLPSGMSIAGISTTEWSCSNTSQTVTCTKASMNKGSAPVILVTANVDTSTLGNVVNRSRVSSATTDRVPGNNTSNVTTNVSWSSDLSLTKTGAATANAGEAITYTMTAANLGPSNSTGIVITDTLPTGMTYSTNNLGWTCTLRSGNRVRCTGGDLAFGATKELKLTANIGPAVRGLLTNEAVVRTSSQDLILGNNTSSANTTVQGVADLSVGKIVSKHNPNVGSTVVFTVTVTNNGPSQASGVKVGDELPAGYNNVIVTPQQGSYLNGVWDVGTLGLHASARLVISASVKPTGPYNNTAQVTAVNESDPFIGNNSTTTSVTPVQADLSLTKTVSNSNPNVGSQITFTLRVLNSGPNATGGIQVQDILPAGLTFVNATTGYNSGTGIWTVGSLQVGQEAVLTITVQVGSTGVITNTAQITASDLYDPDSTPGNNVPTEDDYASVELTASYRIYFPIISQTLP